MSSNQLRRQIEDWYLELRGPLLRYLHALRCPHPLAEEIAQETFLRLQRALLEGVQMTDVRAWMFRVARNLSIDSLREEQRFEPSAHDGASRLVRSDGAPDPERQAIEGERMRLLARRMARLPRTERECLRLRAAGLRYREIAEVLGIPMSAVVEYVRRAVRRLGRRFKVE